jgi:hypothetical protein
MKAAMVGVISISNSNAFDGNAGTKEKKNEGGWALANKEQRRQHQHNHPFFAQPSLTMIIITS